MNTLKKNLPVTLVIILVFLCVTPFVASAETFMAKVMWGLVAGLFGKIMALGGLLLNWGIQDFVVGFGDGFKYSGVGRAVDTLWVSVRDIFNITFIFGLVYIGLKMILNSGDSGARKWLINLILAALLVNFSLYITKFVVDFSNILATQIASGFIDADGDVNVSETFMNQLGVTSMLDAKGEVTKGMLEGEETPWGYIFGAAITFLVAGFVFAAGGLLLIIRYGVLCIYMVLSPLMFLGWVFPGLQRVSNEYWSGFLGRAFFAPMYLLMLYFAATVLQSFAETNKAAGVEGHFAKAWGGDGDATTASFQSTFPPFILAMVFLVASIVIANKMGAHGAQGAVNIMNKTKDWGKQKLRNGRDRAWRTSKGAVSQTGGRVARRATVGLGNTLDRQVSRMQNSNNRAFRGASRALGATSAYQATQNAMRNSRFGLSRTLEQDTQARNEVDTRADREGVVNTNQPAPITAASTATQITASQDARRAQESAVRQMSNQEVQDMARRDRNEVMSPEFASLMSDAQVTALRDSGILENSEMTTLDQNRDLGAMEQINQTLANGNSSTDNLNSAVDNLNRAVGSMSNERIRNMADTERNQPHVAAALSQTQYDTYMQSDAAQADKNNLRTARNTGLQQIVQNGSPASTNAASPGANDATFQDRQRRSLFRNAQHAGAMPAAALAHQNAREYLSPRIVEEFLNNNPSPADINLVRTNIEDYITDPTTPASVTNTWQNWMNKTVAGRRFA